MTWIKMINEPEATGKLNRLYRANIDPEHGVVDNILKVHSLRPDTLDAHLKLYRSVLHPRDPQGLTSIERESIGVLVSLYNHCVY